MQYNYNKCKLMILSNQSVFCIKKEVIKIQSSSNYDIFIFVVTKKCLNHKMCSKSISKTFEPDHKASLKKTSVRKIK